jgi:RNA polymerase sigma factor (sigma-70 family)
MSALSATQPQSQRDEQDLVAAVRRGDDQAFGELYERYGRRIVSYVFGMVGDHGRAEDIAQEVFMSALTRMRATERPIAFKPWIYEIAKNACIDEFRRTRRTNEVPLDSDDDGGASDYKLVSHGSSPQVAAERHQQLDDLRSAFRGLSDNHHKVLVLRELEGLSYAEIGRRLGMSRPVVESTLFRARKRLGQEYEEIASGRRCEQVRGVIDAGGARAVQSLGIRQRRRLARHVAHCQPCRRYAWFAGVDTAALQPPSLAEKIAALLPIPAFLRFRRAAADDEATARSSLHPIASLRSVQAFVQVLDSATPALSMGGRVAAAVAAVVIAGGAAVATTGLGGHAAGKPGPSAARAVVIGSSGSGPAHAGSAGSGSARVASVSTAGTSSGVSASGGPSSTSPTGSTLATPTVSHPTLRTTTAGGHTPSNPPTTNGVPTNLPPLQTPPTPNLPTVTTLPTVPNVPTVGLPPVPPLPVPPPPGGVPTVGVPTVGVPTVGVPAGGVPTGGVPTLPQVPNAVPGVPDPVPPITGTVGVVARRLSVG